MTSIARANIRRNRKTVSVSDFYVPFVFIVEICLPEKLTAAEKSVIIKENVKKQFIVK